jgi:hypothetical protein
MGLIVSCIVYVLFKIGVFSLKKTVFYFENFKNCFNSNLTIKIIIFVSILGLIDK